MSRLTARASRRDAVKVRNVRPDRLAKADRESVPAVDRDDRKCQRDLLVRVARDALGSTCR
jgi:hypothetical protein